MIYDLDPRTKIILVLVLSSFAVFFQNIKILIIVLLLTVLIALILQCDLFGVYNKAKRLIKIMFIIAIAQSVFNNNGTAIISIKSFSILTYEGLERAIEFILRVGIIITSASIVITSNYREIVQGLVQWKVPYEIAFMVSVSIRFLPIFSQELKDAVIAIQLRGIELEKVPLRKKIGLYSYLLMPIISSVIIKAKELSMSMEMRAFGILPQRTSYMTLKMKKMDYNIIAISLIILITGMFIYFTNSF